ncbi:MAG: hypothetical protein E7D52_00995 [Peptoniphilus harei]|nr:hypothetical protein [Peptoniphilus harei]
MKTKKAALKAAFFNSWYKNTVDSKSRPSTGSSKTKKGNLRPRAAIM